MSESCVSVCFLCIGFCLHARFYRSVCVCVCVCVRVCVRARVSVSVRVRMRLCLYVRVYVCVHAHNVCAIRISPSKHTTHTCIYIHTHKHAIRDSPNKHTTHACIYIPTHINRHTLMFALTRSHLHTYTTSRVCTHTPRTAHSHAQRPSLPPPLLHTHTTHACSMRIHAEAFCPKNLENVFYMSHDCVICVT